MTEGEWLAGRDYEAMLRFLHADRCARRGRTDDPKVRLVACFFCRQIWPALTDERSRTAVEVTERHANDEVSDQMLATAADAAWQAWRSAGLRRDDAVASMPNRDFRELLVREWAASAACLAAGRTTDASFRWRGRDRAFYRGLVGQAVQDVYQARALTNRRDQSFQPLVPTPGDVIHEMFGNPFRPAPPIDPAWLAWKGSTVPRLARAVYDNRRLPDGTLQLSHLRILADALEDAGCTDAELLHHLRVPGGPHVMGCWAVDLLLAPEA